MQTIQSYQKTNPFLTPTVVGFLIKEHTVLLGLRKQTQWGLGQNLISGIGGKVGDIESYADETPDEALTREIHEEIGVTITQFHNMGQVIFLFPSKPKWNQAVTIYTIENWEGIPQETEVILPQWYHNKALPYEQMWHDAKDWIPVILEGNTIKAVFLYGNDNRTVIDKKISITPAKKVSTN